MLFKTEDKQTFFAACLMIFFLRMEWGIATSMLPIYVYEVGGSPLEVGLIFTIFAGISTFANPLWGAYSDRIGRRKILIIFGMVGLAPIFLIMSFLRNALMLTLLRGSTAIFVGAIVPSTWALVSDISPSKVVGKNMGLINSFMTAGFGVGPIIGGFIADSFGFSVLWLVVAIICLVGGLIFFFWGKDPKRLKENVKQFHFFEVLKNRDVLILSVTFSIFLLGFSFVGPNYNVHLVKNLGLSKTMVGTVFFIGTVFSALVQPIVGSASDKFGRKCFFMIGALSLTLGNVVFILARNLFLVFLAWILISFYDIFQFMGSAYITDFVSQEKKAEALGFFNSAGSITRSLGAAVGGLVISITSISTVLLVSAVFPIVSIIIIFLCVREKRKAK